MPQPVVPAVPVIQATTPANQAPSPATASSAAQDVTPVERKFPQVKLTTNTTARLDDFVKTTNDFTRNLSATSLVFDNGKGGWARALTINDVPVPGNPGKGKTYGESYAYVGLPINLRSLVERTVAGSGLTGDLDEKRITNDGWCWWKVSNDTKHMAGLLLGGADLHWLDVTELLGRSANVGYRANVVVTVDVKAKTRDGGERTTPTPVTVTVNVLRAIIRSVGGDVDRPMFKTQLQSVSRIAPDDVSYFQNDVATDELVRRLSGLGLNF
ncbi:hypothetical protein KEM52_003021 [Ascosphaera acerosa]|nr:hypothetical protein KEM52_003021 [Ascosphaera acerosa]